MCCSPRQEDQNGNTNLLIHPERINQPIARLASRMTSLLHRYSTAGADSMKSRGERSPEKAGVGGSIPSLATMSSITYRPSKNPFHSDSFQKLWTAETRISDGTWYRSV